MEWSVARVRPNLRVTKLLELKLQTFEDMSCLGGGGGIKAE